MSRVELIWREPADALKLRRALMRAFSEVDQPPVWQEWCVTDDGCPPGLKDLPSPSVRVNETVVASDFATIVAALLSREPKTKVAQPNPAPLGWKRALSLAPSIGIALLPKIACPACWPAYAGVLSSLGVTFLIDARYLFALTSLFLMVALFFLGFRARRRRGYGPLLMGIAASVLLLIGKFYFENEPAMFAGVALLMSASFWNSWPREQAPSPACSGCEPVRP